ncbi:MAG: transcription initiation factor IIB family protein [Promethearchaeota archaeon]
MVLVENKFEIDYVCPECNGNLILVEEKGETVCCQCGLIIYERELDLSRSGKRVYNAQKSENPQIRSPISPLIPDIGLYTFIGKKNINNSDLKRASKRDSHLTWKSRNFLIATIEIKRIGHVLNLPIYVKEAILKLYKKTYRRDLLRGRSINGMVAACIYYICKHKKIPRTFSEVIAESSAKKEDIMNCFKILIKEFNLKIPVTDPISLISKYCANLSFTSETEMLAIKILKTYYEKYSLGGVDPKGLCAGSLYLASKLKNQRINQKKIADVVGTTVVTLRSRYRDLLKSLEI